MKKFKKCRAASSPAAAMSAGTGAVSMEVRSYVDVLKIALAGTASELSSLRESAEVAAKEARGLRVAHLHGGAGL